MITIQNHHLSVSIDPYGAQLTSILAHGREYLWQGSPHSWSSRAPILFPVIGRMRGGTYEVDGVSYTIPAHGFAQTTHFTVTAQTETSVTFSMESSEETLAVYPYHFRFSVSFSLEGNTICKRHQMENLHHTPLYYEVGGHDGFRVPFHPEETMDDCHIRLPGVDCISPYDFDSSVTLLPKARTFPAPDGLVHLKPAAYGLDSVILDHLPQRRAELLDSHGNVRVAVEFPHTDYVTFWTRDCDFDTNFICIEPWSSLPDAHFVGRDLSQKAGIRRLDAGQSENLGYDIIIY